MSFNADAYREAVAPWTFTAGGRTWQARPVSAPAVQRFHTALRAAAGDAGRQERALRTLLRQAFPWRFSYRWRGDPVDRLLRLPPDDRQAALADFFGFLEGKARRALPPTSGTASSPNSPIAA
jgi:hypothetical protein